MAHDSGANQRESIQAFFCFFKSAQCMVPSCDKFYGSRVRWEQGHNNFTSQLRPVAKLPQILLFLLYISSESGFCSYTFFNTTKYRLQRAMRSKSRKSPALSKRISQRIRRPILKLKDLFLLRSRVPCGYMGHKGTLAGYYDKSYRQTLPYFSLFR